MHVTSSLPLLLRFFLSNLTPPLRTGGPLRCLFLLNLPSIFLPVHYHLGFVHATPQPEVLLSNLPYPTTLKIFSTTSHILALKMTSKPPVLRMPPLHTLLSLLKTLPEFLWKDWDALIDWKADFDSVLTVAIIETVGRLQDFFDNPHIYLPFRLPNLQEKAKDSELSDLIETTIQEANPPVRTLHNIIGNFFKPSAVLAALGGPESIQKYVYGGLAPSEWAPIGPAAVELLFQELKTKVHSDTISDPDLRTHMSERWFPKKTPPIDKDDFWHTSVRVTCPPVLTAPMPALPLVNSASMVQLVSPFSAHVDQYLSQQAHTYSIDVLLSQQVPPFNPPVLPFFLNSSLILKLPFLTSYFRGWETLQTASAALVLYEDAGSISSFAFGSVENFSRLFLLIFNPLQEHLQFCLLIQHVQPPPEVVAILKGLRASWQLPSRLSSYTYVHNFFSALVVFDNIHQQQLSSFTFFHSYGDSLIPITLDLLSLLPILSSLFEQSTDTPMWCPDTLPHFAASIPLIQHCQLLIFLHLSYMQHYQHGNTPFIFLNWFQEHQDISQPDTLFCLQSSPPTRDAVRTIVCPHIFLPRSCTDLTSNHYGLVVQTAASVYSEFDAAALDVQFITYP